MYTEPVLTSLKHIMDLIKRSFVLQVIVLYTFGLFNLGDGKKCIWTECQPLTQVDRGCKESADNVRTKECSEGHQFKCCTDKRIKRDQSPANITEVHSDICWLSGCDVPSLLKTTCPINERGKKIPQKDPCTDNFQLKCCVDPKYTSRQEPVKRYGLEKATCQAADNDDRGCGLAKEIWRQSCGEGGDKFACEPLPHNVHVNAQPREMSITMSISVTVEKKRD